MSLRIDVSALSVNRLKSNIPFEKYNIDVSIDEVENNEAGIKLAFKFVILSTPTNAKISIEGVTSISGNENEVSKYLTPDERNIPQVVNLVYQELLPLLYVLTKSIGIPCPAYKISQISQTQVPPTTSSKQIQEEPQTQPKLVEPVEEPQEIKSSQTHPEQVPSEQVPSEQVPSEQVPSEQVPSEQVPAKEDDNVLDELEKLVEAQNVSSI